MATSPPVANIRAIAFDVFGTVVDWRGSITREAISIAADKGIGGNWAAFADAWRAGYVPAMDRVRRGELPWMTIDVLHEMILADIVSRFGLEGLNEAERDHLNHAWHRLTPWPDSVPGLTRLKKRFTITTLSNGNFSLLVNMARQAGLPWDCVISAELFGHYKPDPETYLGTARLLDIPTSALMLVASHPNDLRAARAQGCRTAYIIRPMEFGAGHPLPEYDADEFDIVARDLVDLSELLGA